MTAGLQALFIAFSFGAFIEGAAGFGAPVAVSGAMLAGLGFNPFYAAGICLLANTAPVAFGSIGTPVLTLANVTGLPLLALSSMIGRLCAMISVLIPGYLMVVMVGRKKAMQVLPAIVACGVSFAGVQFLRFKHSGAGTHRHHEFAVVHPRHGCFHEIMEAQRNRASRGRQADHDGSGQDTLQRRYLWRGCPTCFSWWRS